MNLLVRCLHQQAKKQIEQQISRKSGSSIQKHQPVILLKRNLLVERFYA